MKLLTYYYSFIRRHVAHDCPDINSYISALKTVSFPLSMVLGACIFQLIVQMNLLGVILAHWPYDYGNVHSKNFIAPSAILTILCYILTRFLLKAYFWNEQRQERMDTYFSKESLDLKVHRILPDSLTFFFILFALLIGFGVWSGVIVCLILLLALELWIQSRFNK